VAVAAQQLIQSAWIRFEWEFGNRRSALRTLPIALKHLALKATFSWLKSHFAFD